MAEDSDELERLSREQLILKARVLGVERAELMTRVELRDEIVRRSVPDPAQQKRARGFLGVARDLVASVVEAGLNLPDAAALIRGEGTREGDWRGPPPVATVTLAEIYAAQGHLERALRMLDEVLAKEPDHDPARALRERLAAGDAPSATTASPRKRTKINFVEPPPESSEPDPDTDLEPEAPSVSEPVAEPVPAAEPIPAPEPAAAAPNGVTAEPPAAEAAPAAAFEPAAEAAPAAREAEPAAAAPAEPAAAPEPAVAPEPPAPEPPAPAPEPAAPEPAAASAAEAAPPTRAEAPAPTAAPAPAPLCLFTFSLSGRRQVYWEVPDATWEPLRARAPGGRALLRVISFRTRAGKVERRALDIAPHAAVGSSELPGLGANTVVRAALGWEVGGRFTPYLLAADLGSSVEGADREGHFRPHPMVGPVPPEAEQRALSHLLRRP